MKTAVTTVLLLALACSVRGSSFGWMSWGDDDGDTEILPQAPVRNQCLQKAALGQCAFYDCLEERFPCGEDGYLLRISKHFCAIILPRLDEFDAFGRLWLNHTSTCLVGAMKTIYEKDATTCSEIQDVGIESIIDCNDGLVDGKDFCHFTNTNSDIYNSLMGSNELRLLVSLREPRVITSMMTQAISCGVDSLADTWNDIASSVSDGFRNIWRWIRRTGNERDEIV